MPDVTPPKSVSSALRWQITQNFLHLPLLQCLLPLNQVGPLLLDPGQLQISRLTPLQEMKYIRIKCKTHQKRKHYNTRSLRAPFFSYVYMVDWRVQWKQYKHSTITGITGHKLREACISSTCPTDWALFGSGHYLHDYGIPRYTNIHTRNYSPRHNLPSEVQHHFVITVLVTALFHFATWRPSTSTGNVNAT